MGLKKSDLRAILKNEDSSSEEKISEILNLLHEEVDAVKDEKDTLKQELTEAKQALEEAKTAKGEDEEGWQAKYEAEKKAFESFKNEQSAKEARKAQEQAFAEALKTAGVSEKMLGMIADTKKADEIINGIKFDKDGKIEGADELSNMLKSNYADYISTQETHGANTQTPPDNSGNTKTKAEILAIKDASERQRAIAENHELFGF